MRERSKSEPPFFRFAILEHLILLVINVIECPIVLENLFLICRMRGDSLHHQSLLLLNVLTSINHFKTSQDYCHLHSLYNSINAPGEWIKQLKDKLTTDQMQMTAFAEYIASLAAGGKSSLSGQLVAHCVSMLSQQTSSTLSIIYPKFNTQIDEWIMSLVQMANLHHTNFNSCVQALACVCTNMNTLVFRIRGETMACVLDLFLSSSSTSSSIRHHLIDSFNNDRSIHISVFSDLIHNIKPRLNLLQALLSSRQYSVSSLVSSIESYYEDKESSIIAKLLLHALIHHYPNVKSWCAAALTKPKNNYGGKRSEMPSVSTLKSRLEKMLAETTAAVDVLVLDDHCDHNSINGEIFSNVFEDNIDYSDFVPDDGGELW